MCHNMEFYYYHLYNQIRLAHRIIHMFLQDKKYDIHYYIYTYIQYLNINLQCIYCLLNLPLYFV